MMRGSLRAVMQITSRSYRYFGSRVASNLVNRATLFTEGVSIAEDWSIHGILHIRNAGQIVIGSGLTINSGIANNPIGGDSGCWLVTRAGARLEIGAQCGISNSTLYATSSVIIGNRVLIGGGCKIYDTDFHPIQAASRLRGDLPASKPVRIGDDVFLGGHAIVLKGVTIGNGAVIGAGSIVAKDVPAGQVWAGNPARFVKSLI